jgi:uracil phosphoribosyltransferase
MKHFRNVTLVTSLTFLRDKTTKTDTFRKHTSVVSKLLIIAAMEHLKLKRKKVITPLGPFIGKTLVDEVIVVPVLRAGLGILSAIQDFLPQVSVGFIGLTRDEKTAQAHEYYRKLPHIFKTHTVFLVDPMLATGGSLTESIRTLYDKGAKKIIIVCIVAAPEGIEVLVKAHPEVHIYTAAIDEKLNNQKFIVPGLGDFGDRYFGTVES